MKTAKEYWEHQTQNVGTDLSFTTNAIEAIKEAIKDTVLLCAERTCICDDNHNPVITKAEILNIINEIK